MKRNVIEYLEVTASRFPDKIAIEDECSTITFSELLSSAQKIAGKLIESGVQRNQPIAVFLPKSIKAIEVFLGVLCAGCFYVPIDVGNPKLRFLSILNKIKPALIVTESNYIDLLDEVDSSAVINYVDLFDSSSSCNKYILNIDTDPAYVISTSGSTGDPKGVVVSHRSVIDYIDWAINTYAINKDIVIGNQAPFVFDNSVLDIYLMLSTGAKLCLIPERFFIFPVKLIEYLENKDVNFIFWVPSIMANVMKMRSLENRSEYKLTHVLFAGEVMPSKVYMYWKGYFKSAVFSNLYGPTEITVDCTYAILEKDYNEQESIPIGFPCQNTDVIVLNENDELVVEQDILGELCVRGSSLALGYYNDLEKTAEVFTQNPLNPHYPELIYRTGDMVYYNEFGELMYKGRKDFQIKHMGYRIELGEIETAVLALDGIDNACILYDSNNQRIVLVYESRDKIDRKSILLALHGKLPKYMLPNRFEMLDSMPLNINGKIDRSSLQKDFIND